MLQPFLAMLHVYSGCRHSQLLHFILTFKRALQYLGIIVEWPSDCDGSPIYSRKKFSNLLSINAITGMNAQSKHFFLPRVEGTWERIARRQCTAKKLCRHTPWCSQFSTFFFSLNILATTKHSHMCSAGIRWLPKLATVPTWQRSDVQLLCLHASQLNSYFAFSSTF